MMSELLVFIVQICLCRSNVISLETKKRCDVLSLYFLSVFKFRSTNKVLSLCAPFYHLLFFCSHCVSRMRNYLERQAYRRERIGVMPHAGTNLALSLAQNIQILTPNSKRNPNPKTFFHAQSVEPELFLAGLPGRSCQKVLLFVRRC